VAQPVRRGKLIASCSLITSQPTGACFFAFYCEGDIRAQSVWQASC
jgi:hypothetical protein